MTPQGPRSLRPGTIVVLAALLASFASATSASAAASPPSCGNGVVEAGEQCDSGSSAGSPGCNTLCERIDFEPAAPPQARILNPHLACKPAAIRDGARLLDPVHVRYRIHLCRTTKGVDAFTPEQVRAVMAKSTTEFARGGVVLEEEALVRFTENDCGVVLGDKGWSDALVANTPPGVLTIAFVSSISNPGGGFGVGGFCSFFGPFCVNAGTYDTLVVHELGHFFGLAHTFECTYGIETAQNCADAGDMICDTPPDRGPVGSGVIAQCSNGTLLSGTCSGTCAKKTCTDGSKPDGYNWMSYYDCSPGSFSNEQRDFMRCTLDHELVGYNADAGATTTTTSSTTTLPPPVCGDMNGDGGLTAADALGVLRAGVGVLSCATWKCDYDGSGKVTASDALLVLRAAVGSPGTAKCPPEFP